MVEGEGGESENELLSDLQGTPESVLCAKLEAWCLLQEGFEKSTFSGLTSVPILGEIE